MPKCLHHRVWIALSASCLAAVVLATEHSTIHNKYQWDRVALDTYATQQLDQDTRVARPRQMRREAVQVNAEFQSVTAFPRPEIGFTDAIERIDARGSLK